ncbi:MAG TPA: response regulator transcription factor [Candidatus Avipropionibacterium avicola]|uniref:Response regulator transcription factor n=1 Tax=Candidatus Avipropionibacterium avicola TaxID=2840701 RepID=A0A9D1H0D9_9ACTN|nr:response regulator transcription factor [Candidatus Avipropionibacterium avicola]
MAAEAQHDPVTVVVVDDHPVVRAGLRALIGATDDLVVVGEAHDLPSAESVVASTTPQVVLMDLNLGAGADGVTVTRRLLASADPPRILVLTTYGTESDILAALEAGATGYLLKDAPAAELFTAIRAASRGTAALSEPVAATLVRRAAQREPSLTDREIEVLRLLARGLGNRDLARELRVSEATVKSHLSHIYDKLGVDTRAGAVATAIERRIIRAE